jgi:hypothetical protein
MRDIQGRIRNARSIAARHDTGALAGRSVRRVISAGVEEYDRGRHLPRLIPVWPKEIADRSEAGRRAILLKLLKALRAERNRGRAGHWTYDLNRHIGLCQALIAERGRPGIGTPASRIRSEQSETSAPKGRRD